MSHVPRRLTDGRVVHRRTADFHRAESAYQSFNKKVALGLTRGVGNMTAFWCFCLLSLCSLPAVLSAFSPFAHAFPSIIIKASIIALVSWVAQTFLQLVLLPALMVGQNLQNEAADVRSEKQFQDTEVIVDRLDVDTQGGLQSVVAAVKVLEAKVDALHLRLP